MATQTSSATTPRAVDSALKGADGAATPPLLVVDLGKRQSKGKIKDLRKGQGKLVPRIESIMRDLVQAGTVSAGAQPVVIVVREEAPTVWPFS